MTFEMKTNKQTYKTDGKTKWKSFIRTDSVQSYMCSNLYFKEQLWCDSGLVGGDATLRFKMHSALPELQSDLLNNTRVEAN